MIILVHEDIHPDGHKYEEIIKEDGTRKFRKTPLYSKKTQHRERGQYMMECLFPGGYMDTTEDEDPQ